MSMFPGNVRSETIEPNEAEKIEASVASKESKLYAARKLSSFFEVDVTIKMFGHIVWSWHFPPSN